MKIQQYITSKTRAVTQKLINSWMLLKFFLLNKYYNKVYLQERRNPVCTRPVAQSLLSQINNSSECCVSKILITKLQTQSQFAGKMSEENLLTKSKQLMYKRWPNPCSKMWHTVFISSTWGRRFLDMNRNPCWCKTLMRWIETKSNMVLRNHAARDRTMGDARAEKALEYCGGWHPLLCTCNESGLNVLPQVLQLHHVYQKLDFKFKCKNASKHLSNMIDLETYEHRWSMSPKFGGGKQLLTASWRAFSQSKLVNPGWRGLREANRIQVRFSKTTLIIELIQFTSELN